MLNHENNEPATHGTAAATTTSARGAPNAAHIDAPTAPNIPRPTTTNAPTPPSRNRSNAFAGPRLATSRTTHASVKPMDHGRLNGFMRSRTGASIAHGVAWYVRRVPRVPSLHVVVGAVVVVGVVGCRVDD